MLMRDALQTARTLKHPETLFWATAVLLDGAQAPQHQEELGSLAAESNEWPRAGVSVGTLGVFLMHNGSVHLAQGDRRGAEQTWAELEEMAIRHPREPRKIVTDKLRSYGVAHRELIPETIHSTKQYENNRAEQSCMDSSSFASILFDCVKVRLPTCIRSH